MRVHDHTQVIISRCFFCCLPLATGVVGAALAAFGARLMPLQPLFVGLSLSSLAYSFYQAYRTGATCSADGCHVPTALRRRRLVLWLVAFAVVAMLTANLWANWVIYWSCTRRCVAMKNIRVVAAALGMLLLLCGYFPSTVAYAPVATAAPKLSDLKAIDELRTLFNNHVGTVRLVLLLSPT